MAFSFGGNPTQPTPGLNLGQAQQPQQPAFGFSNPQPQSGFQLGTSAPSFGFGTATQPVATGVGTLGSGFAFGAPAAPAASGGLTFGTPTPAFGVPATTAAPGYAYGFGAPVATTGATTGFSYGQLAQAQPNTSLVFAQPMAAANPGTTAFGNAFGTAPAPAAAPGATSTSIFGGGGGFSFGTTPAAPAAPAAPAFSFSTPAAPATSTASLFGGTGFTLGSAATTGAPPTQSPFGQTAFTGFGSPPVASVAPVSAAPSMPIMSGATTTTAFAAPTAQTLNFEAPATTQSGFSFAAPISGGVAPNTSAPPSYAIGLTAQVPATTTIVPKLTPVATTGFSSPFTMTAPGSTQTATAPNAGLFFGTPATSKITLSGFTPTATTTSTAGLSFGTMPTVPTTATSTTASLMTAASTPATSVPSFPISTFTTPKMATPAATTAISSAPLTTTASTMAAPATVGFTTGGLSSILTAATAASTTAAVTVTDSSALAQPAVAAAGQLSFRQLEEAINRWNLELSDQERIFLNQATQVNAWDRLLITNGQKIKGLHDSVERVKLEQERLDHELDFIVSQQRELEELLAPLEKTLDDTPALSIQQHADLQREHTYHMAEKVDGQLKRMADDIKQIIDHLNTTQNQDDSDPMQQVSKILNAHMDALQWVDQNTEVLQKKIEEISKTMDSTKKDQELSWRISYN